MGNIRSILPRTPYIDTLCVNMMKAGYAVNMTGNRVSIRNDTTVVAIAIRQQGDLWQLWYDTRHVTDEPNTTQRGTNEQRD